MRLSSMHTSTPGSLTASELIERACKKYRSDPIATFDGETWTYGEAWDRGGQLAEALHHQGIQKGSKVGVIMSNQLEYLTANFACVRGGYVNVPMNDMLTADEFKYILSDSGASVAIVGENFVDIVHDLQTELPELRLIVAVADSPPSSMIPLSTLLDGEYRSNTRVSVDPGDLLRLSYTGGTTGKPKGARHTQGVLAMNMLAHILDLEIRHGEKMLFMTPLPHGAGYMHLAGLLKGAHLTLEQEFDVEKFSTLVEEERIEWTFMVPTMIYRVLSYQQETPTDLSSLETVVYGAAPINQETLKDALDTFGDVFIQLYAQTEMPDIGTILPKEDHTSGSEKIQSCGKPAVMVDVRVANPDDPADTSPLDSGEIGEVLLKSPYIMDGYHQLPQQTEETIVNGWLRTGDIARMDEEGYVYLLDRANDMIISGGMNIYSIEVEDALNKHPDVSQVAVIGVPHEDWGEVVHAVVVSQNDTLTCEQIRNFADDHLAPYKKPKSVEIKKELPTTPYGKIDKKTIRKPYWGQEDRQIN